MTRKLVAVGAAVVALGVLIGLYVSSWATSFPRRWPPRAPPPAQRRQPRRSDRRGGRAEVEPVAPRLGLLPGPQQRQVGAQHDLQGAGQLDRARHDLPVRRRQRACATRSSRRCRARSAGPRRSTARRSTSIDPEEASHTFAVPELGVFVPLPGVPEEAKNQCEYAPCEGAAPPHDHVHLPHRQEGPLPLAVLRAVRGRLAHRLRRADADARLHGRLHRSGRSDERTQPRAPLRDHLAGRHADRDAAGRSCCWARSCRPATAASRPPGTSPTTPCCWRWRRRCCCWCVIYLLYAMIYFRQPHGAALEGPAVRGNARVQTAWIVVTSVLVLRSPRTAPCACWPKRRRLGQRPHAADRAEAGRSCRCR